MTDDPGSSGRFKRLGIAALMESVPGVGFVKALADEGVREIRKDLLVENRELRRVVAESRRTITTLSHLAALQQDRIERLEAALEAERRKRRFFPRR